jgi:L-amino acid N-acyltransferase YncA
MGSSVRTVSPSPSSSELLGEFLAEVDADLRGFRFDHYVSYPTTGKDGYVDFAVGRLRQSLNSHEKQVFASGSAESLVVVVSRVPAWDENHFGFRMASIEVVVAPEDPRHSEPLRSAFEHCLADLRARSVRFVSLRLHGDHLAAIHIAQDLGFRYIEAIVWPVAPTSGFSDDLHGVRLMVDDDVAELMVIAGRDTYRRGHFHCDPRFDSKTVDSMYAKWVRTAFDNAQPVTVIEEDGRPAGFFVTNIDAALSEATGYTFGRLQSLAVDSTVRGRGLGGRLFAGTLTLLRNMGAQYIDSGYATKNHVSARIHAKHGFSSVYDEVTFHLWLD